MALDLSSVQTFTDQQILDVLRLSLVSTAIAKEYTVNGRTLARHGPAEIQALIKEYEWRVYRTANGIFAVGATRPPE